MVPKTSEAETQPLELTGTPADVLGPIFALLQNLIDYAGLFPPAQLGMAQAVTNYMAYSQSEFNWILGRLILPAIRLGEFGDAVGALTASSGELSRWKLSALLGADVASDLARICEFNQRGTPGRSLIDARIDSVEAKASAPDDVCRLDALVPRELTLYLELPLSDCVHESIRAVKQCKDRRLKIRTGGETADKFPAPEAIVEFLVSCMSAGFAFKATAGLHHALRSVHRLTYAPDSPSAMMHGFLNLFLAGAFIRNGMNEGFAVDVLKEESAEAFRFDEQGVTWHEHRLSTHDLFLARRGFTISFGSCSFSEPIDDLRMLHLL